MLSFLSVVNIVPNSHVLRIAAVVSAAYVIVFFVLCAGNGLLSYPVHHDDYTNLSQRWPSHSALIPIWAFPPRPVTYYLIAILSSLGIPVYYLALHAFTIGYTAGALAVMSRFLQWDPIPWIVLLSASAAALSIENAIEYSKYTGLMTSLGSGFFAVAAMYAMLTLSPRPWAIAGIAALAALSLFSKEDFAVSILLLAGSMLWSRRNSSERCGWIALFLTLCALLAAAVLYNRIAASPFTSSLSGTYKPDFSPLSVVGTSWIYLTQTPVAAAISSLQAVAFAAALLSPGRISRSRTLLVNAIALAPLLPYACLPRHMTFYYPFLWTVWQASLSILLLARLLPARAAIPAVAAVGVVLLAIGQPGRAQTARFYQSASDRNISIVRFLRTNADLLRKYRTVAVEGAPVLGPWFGSDGSFLANRYRLDHEWIVRAPREGAYYQGIVGLLDTTTQGRVHTVPIESSLQPDLPLIKLNPDGTGTLALPRR